MLEDYHKFQVAQGLNDTTIMFCPDCGLSYVLIVFPNRAIWQLMDFIDSSHEKIPNPSPCAFTDPTKQSVKNE